MVEKVVQRLGKRRSAGGIRTSQGAEQIGAGTLMAVSFHDEHGSAERTEMLALDFNRGNQIAMAVEVESRTTLAELHQLPQRGPQVAKPCIRKA